MSQAQSRWWLLALMALYTLLRLPQLLHQAGGQDEQFFSVPGYTVLREGIPRIPFLPSRNRATFFENADRCMMALPPGLFYAQAPFFALFPAGYPTSRLPSFIGALALIAMTYGLSRQLGSQPSVALGAAAVLTISRPLMFTGILARPDLLCVLCGVGAVMILMRSQSWDTLKVPLLVGGLCGLGALFHPFALVFMLIAAPTLALASGSIRVRAQRVIAVGASSVTVLCLWLPLILSYPEEFKSQFGSNVLERSGPGLFSRLLWPFEFLVHQFGNLLEFAGVWQLVLLALVLLATTVISVRCFPRPRWDLIGLSWSSVYLTATVAGRHPTLGYWLFPTIILLACGAAAISQLPMRRSYQLVLAAIVMLMLLPGAGLRTSLTYLQHFGQKEYHSRRFIADVLADLPKEGVFICDLSYAFDVYLSGRDTILSGGQSDTWGPPPKHFDYLILGWEGMDAKVPEQFGTNQFQLIGDPKVIGQSYVYIYTSEQP